MMRVCAALGTWQIVMLAAALRQADREGHGGGGRDVLLLYGGAALTPGLRELMPRIARAAWPWSSVAWADDLLDRRQVPSIAEFRRLLGSIRGRAGAEGGHIDQLWCSKLWDSPEKLLCDAFPEAAVMLFEDGLNDYIPRPIRSWRSLYGFDRPGRLIRRPRRLAGALRDRIAGRHRMTATQVRCVVDATHADRIARSYLSIADQVPLPPHLGRRPRSAICPDLLRRAVADSASAVVGDMPPVGDPDRTVLVLGQCFWRWGGLDRDAEIRACRAAVSTLIDRGYDVLWKDHPRADPPLADPVGRGFPGGRFAPLDLPPACPVELALGRIGAAAIASASSSALFYAPKISGILPYHLGAHFEGLSGDFSTMCTLTSEHIPSLDALPDRTTGAWARTAP